jgi:hypothetical protein
VQPTSILNLLEIPHFGRSKEINICVKLLLSFLHKGFLWLDKVVFIDTQLIAHITRLPLVGEYILPLFTDKTQEKSLAKIMKEKYGTFREVRRLDVTSINDDTIRFVTQVLACMLLRKCRKYQVPT